MVKAPVCGTGDRRFESDYPPHFLNLQDISLADLRLLRYNFKKVNIGVSSSGKTQHFDCCIRRFKSCHPSHKSASIFYACRFYFLPFTFLPFQGSPIIPKLSVVTAPDGRSPICHFATFPTPWGESPFTREAINGFGLRFYFFNCYSINFSALRRTVHIANIIVNRFELALRKRICELIKQEYKSISYCGNQCADFEYSLAYAVDIAGV